jgi:pimeloyl-ACP methyl ester carboxylesterase/DNA-binding winged helix-turn-helix (wHTH) protein
MAIFTFDAFELDTALFELRRDGESRPMEPQVFTVLAYLMEHRDRVVAKTELMEHVWGDRFISEAAITSRLMAARKALGDSGREQRYIRTVHSRGYQFVGRVREGPQALGRTAIAASTPTISVEASRPAGNQEIKFCATPDGARIAFATVGEGPPLVKAANWLSHLEFDWRSPIWRHWIEELSLYHTYIRYDERGCGLSDWEAPLSFEAYLTDLESVVDACGLERFPLIGISQGGPVAIAYAIRHPERVSHLILYGAYAKGRRVRATPEQMEEFDAVLTVTRLGWGRDNPAYRQMFASTFVPGANEEQMRWFNDLCRVSTSPEKAVEFLLVNGNIDVQDQLPHVTTPTLVLHARGDARVPFDEGRTLAASIPAARFVPLDSSNHILLEREPAFAMLMREVRTFLGVPADDALSAATMSTQSSSPT